MSEAGLFSQYATYSEGLDPVVSAQRLEDYGKNVIEADTQRSFLQKLAAVAINPFKLVLLGVLVVTVFTDIIFSTEKSFSTAVLIFSTVIISAVVGYTQEKKSSNTAMKLHLVYL